ncbi:hypothetical protein B6U99_07325 [Candidatus Geothermarchaeota archaeon ex4572_27]|nr:MAG: hypothetical protein B6U99_07325 [Candidatus Geothermarchaeota archaeon ex4572_27]
MRLLGGVELAEIGQLALSEGRRCIQCGACSSACPSARATRSFSPRRVLLSLFRGATTEVEEEQWLCLLCHTCEAVCPNSARIVDLVEALRRSRVRRGVEDEALLAYREALENVLRMGVVVPPTSSEAEGFSRAKGVGPRQLPPEARSRLEEVLGVVREVVAHAR